MSSGPTTQHATSSRDSHQSKVKVIYTSPSLIQLAYNEVELYLITGQRSFNFQLCINDKALFNKI